MSTKTSRIASALLISLAAAACSVPPPAPAPEPAAPVAPPAPPVEAPPAPAVSVVNGHAWSDVMERLSAAVQESARQSGMEVSRTESNELLIRASGDASFASGSTNLSPSFAAFLDKLGETLAGQLSLKVVVVGHTDSSGSNSANQRVSDKRAYVTASRLFDRGVAADRILVDGRGEADPIADNNTPAGRAKNRRVDLLITDPADH